MPVHLAFDLLAVALAALLTVAVHLWRLRDLPRTPLRAGEGYFLALGLGVMVGSFGLGTLNLWLSGVPAVGRSIIGALAGGIAAVEIYKARAGITGSTGLTFVPTFAVLVAVGRIGCALSGLEDNTYGIPTTLPWGHDFGDGIPRHPVAAYEALAMAAFLAVALLALARRNPLFMAHGFYLMVALYGLQRFAWEFLKPYGTILGPLNLFHVTALCLVAYGVAMIARTKGHP